MPNKWDCVQKAIITLAHMHYLVFSNPRKVSGVSIYSSLCREETEVEEHLWLSKNDIKGNITIFFWVFLTLLEIKCCMPWEKKYLFPHWKFRSALTVMKHSHLFGFSGFYIARWFCLCTTFNLSFRTSSSTYSSWSCKFLIFIGVTSSWRCSKEVYSRR